MKPLLREATTTGLALLVFSISAAGLLSGTHLITRSTIAASEEAEKLALISQVLPSGSFDNDLVRDALPLAVDPLLGLKRPGHYYPAKKAGEVQAIVLEVVAPDGYAGEIRMLVGIQADGRISGVRVTGHRETPGLGDYIEIAKNPWITQFEGAHLDAANLADTPDAAWKVRKDGGRFDYMAGATITPRAVVKATHKALQYFAAHRDTLLRGS